MIDDQYSNNSSTFSFFSKKELTYQKYIEEINIVVEKYNILENDNQLISSIQKTFLYLINYVIELHYKKEVIPKDIEKLFLENPFLKEQINFFLEKKLDNLTKNDSTYIFKDINTILQILSIGSKEDLINLYYNQNYDSISRLFRFYEAVLQSQFQNNNELFTLTFDSFIILLNTFTQICTISSIDIIKEKNINSFIELMTETINIVKYTIPLDEMKINKINSIQGKYLYYFSHIDNIPITINQLEKGLEKYLLSLEKQKDGFILSKDKNFKDENTIWNSEEFLVFKNYSSILTLKLLKNLEDTFAECNYFYTEYFQRILKFYYKNFLIEFNKEKIASNIKIFHEDLLNSLLYNYNYDSNITKVLNYHSIIEDFIFSGKNFDNKNLEIVYRVLYFASDIDDFKYYHIAQILADSSPIKNEYHEFFKLLIFDLVINKSKNDNYLSQKEDAINKINDYVEKYTTYHLLSIYSKIYLNLSLFYSYHQKTLEKAKELYVIFLQISDTQNIINEYSDINDIIISNIQSFKQDINQDNLIKNFVYTKLNELKEELLILNNKININPNNDIKVTLVKLISNNIFHGLCEINILDTLSNHDYLKNKEFEEYLIYANKNCIIQFLFSFTNKKNFYSILEYYEVFIKTDICEILNHLKKEDIKYYYRDDEEYEINY